MSDIKQRIFEYFDRYILNAPAFREKELYKFIVKYLLDEYTLTLYSEIPQEISDFLNTAEIHPDLIDHFLISLGLTEEIIRKLTFTHKLIIVKIYGGLIRYKGCIDQFLRIAEDFNEPIAVYELYLVGDGTDWVFRPKLLWMNEGGVRPNLENEIIEFDTIYNHIPEWQITKEQLTADYNAGKLILPHKTHILLFQTSDIIVSSVNTLLFILFYTLFKNTTIYLEFDDGQTFFATLADVVLIYHYIQMRRSNTQHLSATIAPWIIEDAVLAQGWDANTFVQIESDYSLIKHETDPELRRQYIDQFITNWITPLTTAIPDHHVTLTDVYNLCFASHSALITYVEDRLSMDPSAYDDLIDSLFFSLVRFSTGDPIFTQYKSLFITQLFLRSVDARKTTTWLLYSYLKPYHVMLLDYNYSDNIILQDELDSVVTYDKSFIYYFIAFLSSVFLIDRLDFQIQTYPTVYNITDQGDINPTYIRYSNISFSDYTIQHANISVVSVITFNDIGWIRYQHYSYMDFLLISSIVRQLATPAPRDILLFNSHAVTTTGNIALQSTINMFDTYIIRYFYTPVVASSLNLDDNVHIRTSMGSGDLLLVTSIYPED